MSFVCPTCKRESHHPVDERVGWCAACEDFTRDTRERTREIIEGIANEGDVGLALNVLRRYGKVTSV